MEFTFEQLPQAVSLLLAKLGDIEKLLANREPSSENESEQLLTIQQAGEILNLSVPTIYGLVSRSEIPVSKKGKRLYFSKQELLDWVKGGRKKTTSEIAAEAENFTNKRRR